MNQKTSYIHISDIRSFRSCRRKWDWSSPIRQNLEPSTPYAPFFIGRAIHHCLEQYYLTETDVWTSLDAFLQNEQKISGTLWRSEQDQWDESVEMISELLAHYLLWISVDTSEFRDETLEFTDLEVPFKVPMYNPETGIVDPQIMLEGRFDGLVKHKPSNTYWIWETKTARSIGELTKSLENDEQAGAYIFAAQQIHTDIKVSGVLYNILRKKVPTRPRPLQNGMLSKAKNIDTTVFAYVAAIKRHHGDVDWNFVQQHYGDLVNEMGIGNNGFFSRFPVRRSANEIKQLVDNLYWTAMEMIDPKLRIYPAPTFIQCNFCQYRAPCLTMNKGGNFDALLDAEYQKRVAAESFRVVEPE